MTQTIDVDRARADLLARIQQKRRQVTAFIAAALPRKRRLFNVTIVGGTLAAALTAGPAVGGATFTGWLTSTFGLTSPAWQILCGVAAVCSVAATLSTQLLKSHNLEEHLTRAQSCRAKLEVLELGLSTGHLDPAKATDEFIRCVEEVAFLAPADDALS